MPTHRKLRRKNQNINKVSLWRKTFLSGSEEHEETPMSVSLVVLRLEVSDEAESPKLDYQTTEFKQKYEEPRLRYSEVTANHQQRVSSPPLTVDDVKRYRGRREFREVTIESYYTEEAQVTEEEYMERMDDTKQVAELQVAMATASDAGIDESSTNASKDGAKQVTPDQASTPNQPDGTDHSQDHDPDQTHVMKVFSSHSSDGYTGGACGTSEDLFKKDRKKKNRRVRDAESKAYESNMQIDVPAAASDGCKTSESGESGSGMPTYSSVLTQRDSGGSVDGAINAPGSIKPSTSTIHYFCGNPSVEITEGIIHLYKENQMTSLTDDVCRSEMICMLTVPARMTSPDLLQFVAPVEPWVESMKIIRDGTPNMYMVLIKFRNQKHADEFYKTFNNQQFNMIEPEVCHLVYVAKIETIKASEGGSQPVSGLTELPVCPVCLERMDESVDGILTILCSHSFHSSCLAQWGDTSCPVCRYVQTPEHVEDHVCFECDSTESLWICLICGHVGCGRYVGGHAYRHFQETQHAYSMQLGNNRVWDYAGDNYVHRLVQNKGDGKMVQVDEGGNVVQDEKLDSITLEYTYLLTSQLENQRHFFEEKIEHIEKDALKQVEEVEARSKKALDELNRMEQRLNSISKEKSAGEKKSAQLQTRLTKVSTQLKEEQEMNKCLLQNQAQWQDKVTKLEERLEKKDKEVQDLQEQLRDVMFYLEARQKLASTEEVSQQEIKESQVFIGATASGRSHGKKTSKKGR